MLRPKKFYSTVFRLDHPDIWTFTMTSIELSGINHQNFNFYLLSEAKVVNLYSRNSRLGQISGSVCFCEAIQALSKVSENGRNTPWPYPQIVN
jgi:hypothetical protein